MPTASWTYILVPAGLATLGARIWVGWAIRFRQYRWPLHDRRLAAWLRQWFTKLPWGPARGVVTVAVVGLEPWRSGVVASPVGYAVWAVGLTAALCAAALILATATDRYLFHREWVVPLHKALCGELTIRELEAAGWSPTDRFPGRHIRIARDWQYHQRRWWWWLTRDGDGIRISFPLELRLGDRLDKIRDTAVAVLGLRDVDHRWMVDGHRSQLRFTAARVVPTSAPFANSDIRTMIETMLGARPTAPVIALGRGDAPIAVDIDAESPHILISAGTIGGKSATVLNLTAQLLWADPAAIAVVVDSKQHSQRGLAAIPGVAYAREPEEINNALVAVWDEVQSRNRTCRDVPLGAPMPTFPRIILAVEEANVTVTALNGWWRSEHGARSGQAPGVVALDNILCMGRAVRTHVILDGQSVTHRSTGGGAGAANIACRILAEYDANTWRRLAHGADWVPPTSHKRQPGWCVVVHGREVAEGQRIYMRDTEAVAWLTGRGAVGERERNLAALLPDAPPPTAMPHSPKSTGFSSQGARRALAQVEAHGRRNFDENAVDYVTLRDVAGETRMTLAALRKASQQEGFPPAVRMPGGNQYSRRAVIEWASSRSRKPRVEDRPIVYFIVGGGRPYQGGQVKIGYTARPIEERVKELAARQVDVVRTIDVEAPAPGERLPDKDWHDKYARYRVHRDDETSELFWIRGELAEFLGATEGVPA